MVSDREIEMRSTRWTAILRAARLDRVLKRHQAVNIVLKPPFLREIPKKLPRNSQETREKNRKENREENSEKTSGKSQRNNP
jgi:hypothetical protein